MQLDMHYYGVYALARTAGVKPDVARTIAHSSQFVDDSIEDEAIVIEDQRAIVPTMTSHKPIDYQNTIPGDQWRVWVPFHFLPGHGEDADTFVKKMVCGKDSTPARQMLEHALDHKAEAFGPHLAGITAHVYADSFAHYGFVGLSRACNKVNSDSIETYVESKSINNYLWSKFETFKTRVVGSLAEIVPVGHGPVGTFPDRPYLRWKYEYETGEVVERNNVEDFTEASERLHTFFCEFVKGNGAHGDPVEPVPWISIEGKIRTILKQEGPVDERIRLWKEAISSNELFPSTDEDKTVSYSDKAWGAARTAYYLATTGNIDSCDSCLFIRAAWKHRNFILHELLTGIGLIAY